VLRLFDTPLGIRFEGDRVGSWDITDNGRTISCSLSTSEQQHLFHTVLIGPVLPLALTQLGMLCLHGSAVAIDGVGVAFLAPKMHGKSTLALGLTLAGAKLVTDDLVVVDLAGRAMLRPGAQTPRLFDDSIDYLGARNLHDTQSGNAKRALTRLPRARLQADALPLGCVYIVERSDEGAGAAERELLSGAEAVVSIAHRAKLSDDLIGIAAAGARLHRIATVVEQVPVWRLRLARGWQRFDESTNIVHSWHKGHPPSNRIQTATIGDILPTQHWRKESAGFARGVHGSSAER
jgi:hypothetical protein